MSEIIDYDALVRETADNFIKSEPTYEVEGAGDVGPMPYLLADAAFDAMRKAGIELLPASAFFEQRETIKQLAAGQVPDYHKVEKVRIDLAHPPKAA